MLHTEKSWAVIDRPYNLKSSVEHLREVERQDTILESASDHDLFVFRNHSDPRVLSSSSDLLHRNPPAWSNVSVVVDAPDSPTVHGVGQNQSLLGIDRYLTASESASLWSSNDAQRFRVSTGGAIEDQQAITFNDEKIVDGIHGYLRSRRTNLCIGSGENSFWRDVAICIPIEYQHAFRATGSCAPISA